MVNCGTVRSSCRSSERAVDRMGDSGTPIDRPSIRLVPYEQISRGGIQAVMPIPRQGLEIELSSSMTRSQPRSLMSVDSAEKFLM